MSRTSDSRDLCRKLEIPGLSLSASTSAHLVCNQVFSLKEVSIITVVVTQSLNVVTNLDVDNEALDLSVWRVNDEMKAKLFHEIEFDGENVVRDIVRISILHFEVTDVLSGSDCDFVHLAGQEGAGMPEMF